MEQTKLKIKKDNKPEKIFNIKNYENKKGEEIDNKSEKIFNINNYENKKEKEIKSEKILKIDNDFQFQLNLTISAHKGWVRAMKIFPSGNIISVSSDQSIKIYNSFNYNLIQHIEIAHSSDIINLYIKDENNFITCSDDRSIKIWKKNDKYFELNNKIVSAHEERICSVIYCPNYNIISCSNDNTLKIWKLNNSKQYKLINQLKQNKVQSLLLLKDKNILISGGSGGTKIWEIHNNEEIKFDYELEKAIVNCWNGISRIDNDKIIIGGTNALNIISLNEKSIIKTIEIPFICNVLYFMKNKGLILKGEWSKNIKIYRCDNYKCIKTIENAHKKYITDFVQLNNDLIASCSGDGNIKIWSFN